MGPKRRVTNRRYKNKKVSSIEVKREIMCELEESVLNSENEITHSTSSIQYINPEYIFKQRSTSNEVISSSDIKVTLLMWEEISYFILQKHPEKVATARAAALFDDTCLTYFRNILNERNIQHAVDRDQLENYVGGKGSRVATKKRKLGEEKFETLRLKLNGSAREPYVRLERLEDRITPVVLPVMKPVVRLERLPCTLTENYATPKVETCLKKLQHSKITGVMDETTVEVDVRQDTKVAENSTPSSEVIASPVPLRSDPIVVISEQGKAPESVIIQSPSKNHVTENEQVRTNISVKNRPIVITDALGSESVPRNSTCSPEVIDLTFGRKRGRKKRLNGMIKLSSTTLLRRSGRYTRNSMTVKDEPIVEVDIQKDTDEERNCTPSSEVIASPLPLPSAAMVAMPEQRKTQENVVIESPSMDHVKENERVSSDISVKDRPIVIADALESESVPRNSTCSPEVIDLTSGRKRGRKKRLNGMIKLSSTTLLRRSGRYTGNSMTVKDGPIVEVDIQEDINIERNSTPSSEVIASPVPLPSDSIAVIPEATKTRETVIMQSPSKNHVTENERVRANVSVKDEPVVVVDIQQDTSVEGNCTPSSEVITSPLPLPSQPIVLNPEPRETEESVVIQSPSIDHMKENEGVRTNLSGKTPCQTLLSGREPYVRLERLEERYIQSFAARSVTPKSKGTIRLKKLEDILATDKNKEPLVVFEQHTNGGGNNVPSSEFNGCPTPLLGDQIVAIPGQGKTPEIQTTESSPNGPHQLEDLSPMHSPVQDDILLPFHTVFVEELAEENEKEKREETFQPSSAAQNMMIPGANQCNVHPYQCSVQEYFNAHMTSQASFNCDLCSYRTDTLFDLNGHMVVHKNLEPLVCPICHTRYLNNCALKMHMRIH